MSINSKEGRDRLRRMITSANEIPVDQVVLRGDDVTILNEAIEAADRLDAVEQYARRLASDRNFKPISIVEDLDMIVDGYKPDSYILEDK